MFIFLLKNNTLLDILKVNRTLTLMESCIIGTHITTSYIYLHCSVVCFCRCTRRIDNKNTSNLTVLPHKTLQVIILQSERKYYLYGGFQNFCRRKIIIYLITIHMFLVPLMIEYQSQMLHSAKKNQWALF